MLHVRRHLFHEFFYLFNYLFFLILTLLFDISAIFSLLHHSFLSVMKKNVWHSIEPMNNAQLTHPLTSGIHDSNTHICRRRTF